MMKHGLRLTLGALAAAALLGTARADADESAKVQRGKYLVAIGGCSDCHTSGYFLGKPDMTRFLAGSDVGFALPGLGVFVGRNLTPDRKTGLGDWTSEQIVTAIRTGVRPDGRTLAPIMPWRDFANLSDADASAIAAYLKSLPAIEHQVAGPFGPNDKPSVFVMSVLPPDVFNSLPKPPGGAAPK
jgi:mono/diheme cytochrome c family protein